MNALPGKSEGVIYLDGLFFLNKSLIKTNSAMVKNTLKDLYCFITDN